VSEFGDLEKKAQDYVEAHPDQADKGINEATVDPLFSSNLTTPN